MEKVIGKKKPEAEASGFILLQGNGNETRKNVALRYIYPKKGGIWAHQVRVE